MKLINLSKWFLFIRLAGTFTYLVFVSLISGSHINVIYSIEATCKQNKSFHLLVELTRFSVQSRVEFASVVVIKFGFELMSVS